MVHNRWESVSAIICTWKRPKHLLKCLESIDRQHVPIHEILIVDNEKDAGTLALVEKFRQEYSDLGKRLSYIVNPAGNNLPAGRNLGVRLTTGDILLFIDDDVVFKPEYLREILSQYRREENALGVQGIDIDVEKKDIYMIWKRLFLEYHRNQLPPRVFRSATGSYCSNLSVPCPAEWFAGFNQSYRRVVFDSVSFDEKLSGFGDGEDLDFSYRVHRMIEGSLYVNPQARLIHQKAVTGRSLKRDLFKMQEVYGLYLWKKLFRGNRAAFFCYIWNRFGRLVLPTWRALREKDIKRFNEVWFRLTAYVLCIRYARDIFAGRLDRVLLCVDSHKKRTKIS